MSDRREYEASRRGHWMPLRIKASPPRRGYRPTVESIEARALLTATIAPIATVSSPEFLGFQVPLNGSGAGDQTFQVTSSNPDVQATVASGPFLKIDVTHASAGGNDISFSGSMVFQLFEDLTPITVERITRLAEQGFYTDRNFHRIASGFTGPNDFIVQGGSVNGQGGGEVNQPGFPFPDEFVQQLAFTGTGQLAMANAGDDTNSSQFFVTTGSPRFLDFQHTIFGQLVSGQDTLTKMTQVVRSGVDGTTPTSPILISSATVLPANPNGVIHINTTGATAGETSTVTVTATETASGTTATQSFTVNVTPSDPNLNQRPFLLPVENQVTSVGQTSVFKITGQDANPTDVLTYTVQGGLNRTTNTFTAVQNATATVDTNGIVRVVPTPGFTGTIDLLVGVRDQVDRSNTGNLESPLNYDTQTLTLTVNQGEPINLTPIAVPATQGVTSGAQTRIQLTGDTANPASSQTLRFNLVSQPSDGTIDSFDPQTGSLTYTPGPNFTGRDSFQFSVTDVGAPTPNLTSPPATLTLAVSSGSVRRIGTVLVVTPAPRTDGGTNTISVTQSLGFVRVAINGVVDAVQPRLSELDRLVVFGSKASDTITIAPDVDLFATMNGGLGGRNRLNAGGAPTRLHGWFGRNFLRGGPETDALIGRAGSVRFLPSGGSDLAFEGVPQPSGITGQSRPPGGQFYRQIRGRFVPIPTPKSMPIRYRGQAGDGQLLPPGYRG